MHLVEAAMTGWGKSYQAQHLIFKNLPKHDYGVVLDFKDEYRGVVEGGAADWWPVGSREVGLSVEQWEHLFRERSPKVVLPRYQLTSDQWQEVAATVIQALRNLDGTALVVLDEAHIVAPQSGTVPTAVDEMATTGRGEGVSAIIVTQRPAKLDETQLAQSSARLFGGFTSDSDLDKVGGVIDYPQVTHNALSGADSSPGEWRGTDLRPVRVFEDEQGNTVGSEWIYSDTSGNIERKDTRNVEMPAPHYGADGTTIEV